LYVLSSLSLNNIYVNIKNIINILPIFYKQISLSSYEKFNIKNSLNISFSDANKALQNKFFISSNSQFGDINLERTSFDFSRQNITGNKILNRVSILFYQSSLKIYKQNTVLELKTFNIESYRQKNNKIIFNIQSRFYGLYKVNKDCLSNNHLLNSKHLYITKIQKCFYSTQVAQINQQTIKMVYLLENLSNIDSVMNDFYKVLTPKIYTIIKEGYHIDIPNHTRPYDIFTILDLDIKFLFYGKIKGKSLIVKLPHENMESIVIEILQILNPLKKVLESLTYLEKVFKKKYLSKYIKNSLVKFIDHFSNSIFVNQDNNVSSVSLKHFVLDFQNSFNKNNEEYWKSSFLQLVVKNTEILDFKKNLDEISIDNLQRENYIPINTTFDKLLKIQKNIIKEKHNEKL